MEGCAAGYENVLCSVPHDYIRKLTIKEPDEIKGCNSEKIKKVLVFFSSVDLNGIADFSIVDVSNELLKTPP